MGGPRFGLLDVVAIVDTGVPHLEGVVGARGVVIEMRRYPDGRYRYIVAASDNDDANGIWDEADLEPTGEKRSFDLFACPGRYRMRDIVVIDPAGETHSALAGARGVIRGWTDDEAGNFTYLVFVDALGEQKVWLLAETELTATEERLPPAEREYPVTSTRVSEAGEVLGQVDYVILDQISDHL